MPLKKLAKQHRTDSADNLGDSGSLSPVHDTAVNSNKYINGNAYSSSGNDCNVHNNDAVHNNNSVNVNVNTNEEPAETFYSPRTAICRSFSKNPDELYSKLCSELSREEFMQIIYNDPVPVNPFSYLCGKNRCS